jgi:hypothetical protein
MGYRWRRGAAAALIAAIIAAAIISGCGGGTSGTGLPEGQSVVVRGVVYGPDGNGQSGITVTLAETGQVTQTNGAGEFLFEVSEPRSEYTFVLETAVAAAEVTVAAPAEAGALSVDVVFDPTAGTAAESMSDFTPSSAPEAQPE